MDREDFQYLSVLYKSMMVQKIKYNWRLNSNARCTQNQNYLHAKTLSPLTNTPLPWRTSSPPTKHLSAKSSPPQQTPSASKVYLPKAPASTFFSSKPSPSIKTLTRPYTQPYPAVVWIEAPHHCLIGAFWEPRLHWILFQLSRWPLLAQIHISVILHYKPRRLWQSSKMSKQQEPDHLHQHHIKITMQ